MNITKVKSLDFRFISLVAGAAGIVLTLLLWQQAKAATRRQAQAAFETESKEVVDLIKDRFDIYINLLRASAGLFATSSEVTREEWHTFVTAQNLAENYPGLLGLAYIHRVTKAELPTHQADIRAQGFPEYLVRPEGSRPEYYPVVYIEPFSDRNVAALGYDIASDPTRRLSLEASRDTGRPRLTGKITLVQDTQDTSFPGFLLFMPIYQNIASHATLPERQAHLIGFTDVVFRMSDLMSDILTHTSPTVDFEIFDGDRLSQESLLFDTDSRAHLDSPSEAPLFSHTLALQLEGQTWTIYFTPRPHLTSQILADQSYPVLITGILLSGLLFGLLYSLSSSQSRAVSLAQAMTQKFSKSQSLLQAERDRAQAIISSMGDGLVVIDKDHKISLINRTAEKLLDLPSSQAVGRLWVDMVKIFQGDRQLSVQERTFIRTLESGQPKLTTLDDNHYYQTLSGRRFPATSITTPIPEPSGGGAVKVFRDATHEKEEKSFVENQVKIRTRQLQEEKAKLTASLNSLHLGLILIDPIDNILFINPAAVGILGITKNAFTFGDIESRLSTICDLHALHLQAKVQKSPVVIPELLFGTQYLHLSLFPIYLTSKSKDYIGTAILLQDITEAKVLDRSKDEFFSIASHELRTPLTAIRGNSSLIMDFFKDKLSDTPLAEMLTDIHDSSIRLINIVNDFLNLSRLEQGKINFKKANFDLTALVHDVTSELEPSSRDKPLYLKLAKEDIPQYIVNSDKDRVKEVLINLVGNSLKYTDSGGITLDLTPTDGSIKVSVSDTGRGIPPTQQSLLFRKFQQAGASLYTRDTTKGTGLGLYISKLIVEGLGGRIWLEKSDSQVGSTFAFSLPLVTAP